ncbi:MAG TPA: hypothetical protein VJP77_02380 [Planctomycetota bacterium]|nr:hypothetical protein [Planctomycetota bacterium]
MTNAEAQLAGFFARYDPAIARLGKAVRYVPLNAAADLDRAELEALMVAALGLAKLRPVAGAKGAVIVKAEEQKQRAARATKAARPASPSRPKQARR